MPCIVKKTVEWLTANGHDYVICVKNNQPTLYNRIKAIAQTQPALDQQTTQDRGRGRIEYRRIQLFEASPEIQTEWSGAKRVVMVHRYGTRGTQPYDMKHYYVSSLASNDANVFAIGIRGHWGIENRLHWVKDALMKEDCSAIKQHAPAKMMALLRTVALSIYRVNGYDSWKKSTAKFSNKINLLVNLIRT